MNKQDGFFSNTNPDLISAKSIAELTKIVADADPVKKVSLSKTTISLYKKYIQPNILPLIIVIIFISFIIYRYMTHSEKFDPNKSVNNSTQTQLEFSETRNHHEFDNVVNQFMKDKEMNEIFNDESIYENLLDKNESNDREVFTGTHNSWEDNKADDKVDDKVDEMEHPYGYDNRYVETTNNMVNYATKKNKSSLDEAFNKMFN